MPAISFSGTTLRGAFWKLVITNQKRQTVRKPRKKPIKVGDKVTLYWKQRVPKNKKPVHKLGVATVIEVLPYKYSEFAEDSNFAWNDGFVSSSELQEWFGSTVAPGLNLECVCLLRRVAVFVFHSDRRWGIVRK